MKLYFFIIYTFLTICFATNIDAKNVTQGKDYKYSLTSGKIYYFTIYIISDDYVDIQLKMENIYSASVLVSYYYIHNIYSVSESELSSKKPLDPTETYSTTQNILKSTINNSDKEDYITLIIESNENLELIIYVKGRKKVMDDTIKIILMVIFIPLGVCFICFQSKY